MFKSLKIENFRGFEKFEIDGFKQVNLFVGENNCGKTSLLEALFVSVSPENLNLPAKVNQIRNIPANTSGLNDFFSYLFYKFEFSKPIQFTLDKLQTTIL